MKKVNSLVLTVLFIVTYCNLSAQVGINNPTPHPSAALDVTSTDKGLLIPRVFDATAIANPAEGLMVYQTHGIKGFYYYNGSAWKMVGGASELEKVTEEGNTGYRILGRDIANYGVIGQDATDISFSVFPSTTLGATGQYSTAMGNTTTASGIGSTAMSGYTTASGTYSTAIGSFTTASGNSSTALGNGSTASASSSTAMGGYTTASGHYSTAMGNNSTASGTASTAMGFFTNAKSYGEVALGNNNTIYTPLDINSFNAADRAFGVGIGSNSLNKKDGLIVYKDGTLWLDTLTSAPTSPANRLYIQNKKVHFNGVEVGKSELQKLTEGSNTGYRILDRNPSNYGNIGSNAIDLSFSGVSSSTLGATGINSTTMGWNTTASGWYSTAMGYNSTASGEGSTAMSSGTIASERGATAMGLNTIASGLASLAMGVETVASGHSSIAMGIGTKAKSYGELAVGSYGTEYTPLGTYSFHPADRAFSVGLGPYPRKDGLIVYKSGMTFIGNNSITPSDGFSTIIPGRFASALQVIAGGEGFNLVTGTGNNSITIAKASIPDNNNRYISFGHMAAPNFTEIGSIIAYNGGSGVFFASVSDKRLKNDHGIYADGLTTLNNIKIHDYTWKESKTKDVGVFAQELYKVFPLAVSKGDDKTEDDPTKILNRWQVDYSKLVPLLVAATQELSIKVAELERQKVALSAQLEEMATLKNDIDAIKVYLLSDRKVASNRD